MPNSGIARHPADSRRGASDRRAHLNMEAVPRPATPAEPRPATSVWISAGPIVFGIAGWGSPNPRPHARRDVARVQIPDPVPRGCARNWRRLGRCASRCCRLAIRWSWHGGRPGALARRSRTQASLRRDLIGSAGRRRGRQNLGRHRSRRHRSRSPCSMDRGIVVERIPRSRRVHRAWR